MKSNYSSNTYIIMPKYNNNYIIYQASAGSGKTYNLALEYIYLCLKHFPNDTFSHIMAITFTNKAVEEMKSRILKFFTLLAQGKDEILLQNIIQKFKNNNITIQNTDIQLRSKYIINRIHHHYNDFCICTIDSLFQRIARTFATELHLPHNAQIELSTDSIIKDIVSQLLSQIGHNEHITRSLAGYLNKQKEEQKSPDMVEDALKKNGKQLFSEQAIQYIDLLETLNAEDFTDIDKNIKIQRELHKNNIKKEITSLALLFSNNNIDCKDFKGGLRSGLGALVCKYSHTDIDISDMAEKCKKIFNNIHNDELYTKSLAQSKKDCINSIKAELHAAVATIEQETRLALSLNIIYKNFHAISLLHEMNAIKEEIADKNQLIHLSEAGKRIGILLQQEGDYIFQHLGSRYYYFFIDEFQDTSTLQYNNMLPLLQNAVAGSINSSDNETGKVYFFGDEKQSIYRFRNGDVHNMLALTNPLSGAAIIPLQTNYRSFGNIIRFNNAYFSRYGSHEYALISNIYHQPEQCTHHHNDLGWVSISLLFCNTPEDAPEYIKNEAADELMCEVCLNKIISATQQGYQYGDIAVIVRKHKDGFMIAEFLLKHNINIISADALQLKNNADIQFLLALIQYVQQPQNELHKLTILHYIACRQKLALNLILPMAKKDIESFITEQYPLWNREHAARLNIYQKVEYFVQLFAMDKNSPYILTFMEHVNKFYNQRRYGRHQFMEYWEQNDITLACPYNPQAVRIITAHSSKGLEFPVVIYPKTKSQTHKGEEKWVSVPPSLNIKLPSAYISLSNDAANSEFKQEKLENEELKYMDNLNVEYVIFTRAMHQLHIITTDKDEDILTFVSSPNFPMHKDENSKYYILHYTYGQADIPSELLPATPHNNSIILHTPKHTPYSLHTHHTPHEENSPEQLWGNKVHEYLAMIRYAQDIPTVIQHIHNTTWLNEEEKQKLTQSVQAVFTPENKVLLFGNDNAIIKNEVEIWENHQNVLRIDRLIIQGDKAGIIDYKTGSFKQEYIEQINKYAEKISEMGYEVANKTLIFIQKDGTSTLHSC